MTTPIIAPDQHWALWAVLFSAAAFGVWAERTRWGARLSGAVVAIGATFVLSNLGVIPSAAPTYDVVWSTLVPLAIPLLLFRADLRRILREAGPTLLAFAFGAVGSVIGAVVAFHLLPLGPEGWKLAGIFCATYVGGSMNYVAVAEALHLRSPDLLAAGIAADNLAMALYFLVLFAIPSIGLFRRAFAGARRRSGEGGAATGTSAGGPPPSVGGMITALAIAAVACAVGFGLADALGLAGGGILILTALTVAAATLFPRQLGSIGGAAELGTLMMQVFFAAIGASANIGVVLRVGPVLLALAAVILTVHLATILMLGRAFRLGLEEVVVASNANMGGPTTAAAMAVARGWDGLVIPAILSGTLGYAIATFVGAIVGTALH